MRVLLRGLCLTSGLQVSAWFDNATPAWDRPWQCQCRALHVFRNAPVKSEATQIDMCNGNCRAFVARQDNAGCALIQGPATLAATPVPRPHAAQAAHGSTFLSQAKMQELQTVAANVMGWLNAVNRAPQPTTGQQSSMRALQRQGQPIGAATMINTSCTAQDRGIVKNTSHAIPAVCPTAPVMRSTRVGELRPEQSAGST